MQSIDRWLKWVPQQRMSEEALNTELTKQTKPGSVSFVSSIRVQTPIISSTTGGMANHDPEEWATDFARWIQERCARREGREDSGGVGVLHLDFVQWSVDQNNVPCTRHTFERLLRDNEFFVANGMARGLVLIADLRAILPSTGSQRIPQETTPRDRRC
jgi:hypothetical protein